MTGAVAAAMRRRRSQPAVTADAPTKRELLPLIQAAASAADHSALRPWRLIAIRGAARDAVGAALVSASGAVGDAAAKTAAKPLRAPLLLAIVVVLRPSPKVPEWEQEAAAAGVAHALSLLLDEAGWGVMWRTGPEVRSPEVHRAHRLADNERLLGWLYVGGKPAKPKSGRRPAINPAEVLTSL